MTILKTPIHITSRLLAGVEINGTTVSIEATGETDRDGKPSWTTIFDFADGSEHREPGLRGHGDENEMIESALAFLEACAEERDYARRTGRLDYHGTDGNAGLFPAKVGEWAEENSDEIGMVRLEIVEDED